MTNIYIPVLLPDPTTVADNLAKRLYQIHRPLSIVKPWDVTTSFGRGHTHPTDGTVYFEFPENYLMKVHLVADPYILDEFLLPFVASSEITTQVLNDIHAAIDNNRGIQVSFSNFIPQFWLNQQKTFQELIDLGFFPAT